MIACLYDVHGNLPALEAVLADAAQAGAGSFVLGGDYTLFGGWPRETVARLREIPRATWIRGNGERWTAHPEDAPDHAQEAIAACAAALGEGLVGDLAALPERAEIASALIVHGSPRSDVESFMPEPAGNEDDLLAGELPPRLVFGHTHLPFTRQHGDVELLNPGSVGMPLDGDPRASYALLHEDGAIEHRRVAYDHEAAAARVPEAFGAAPWTQQVATRIRQARFVA